jgi:hypothetical protein
MKLVLCLLLGVGVSSTPAADDEVKSLPGWDKPLPSKQYSGYLPVGTSKGQLHYYYTESEGNPSTDPLTLWLNGGPGSSSIAYGMMTEIGQLVFNRDSLSRNNTEVPALQYNRWGWSKFSNMLYLESPAGVGFSYCEAPPCKSNDTSTALDSYDALLGFFDRFPELKKRKFYISGESYGGIYCPMLAEQIMNRNTDASINLQGLMIGNGCWGNKIGTCGFSDDEIRLEVEYQFGHSLFSQRLYKKINAACQFPVPTPPSWKPSAACSAAVAEIDLQSGAAKWDNPNTYDFCEIEGLTGGSEQARMLKYGTTERELVAEGRERWAARVAALSVSPQQAAVATAGPDADFGPAPFESTGPLGMQQMWCGGADAYKVWSALPAVHQAWHVKPHDATSDMQYTRAPAGDLRSLYKTLAQKYRLLIYSGDSDGCVPHVGTEEWTADLGFEVADEWRPWVCDASESGFNATATAKAVGYVVQFGGGSKDFRFATVMGSGHEVPTFKPIPSYAMIRRFQDGSPL